MQQVRVREHERGTPLYVVIRKWVQNDPDTDLLPTSLQPGGADPSAAAGGGKVPPAPQLPPLPPAEDMEEVPPPREGPLLHPHRELPPTDVTLDCFPFFCQPCLQALPLPVSVHEPVMSAPRCSWH